MPTYSLESPQTGQKYQVQFDREPSPEDLDFAAKQFDSEWWKQQGIEPGSAITQQTPLETVGNAIANVGPNLVDMVGGGMRYLDKAAQVVADVTGTQRGGLFADVAKQAEGIKAEGDVLRPLSPANPMAQAIGGGASQGIGLMATAAASVPALGARGLMAVPAVLGFGAGGGAGVQQAEQMGITSPAAQLGMGTAFGAAEAGTEALGGIGGAFFKPAKTMLGRMAGGVLSEGIEEPAAGALQDAITNVAALAVADPKRPGFTTTGFQIPGPAGYLERRQQEAIGGLAGGLVFAGVQPLMRAPGVGQPLSEAPASAPDAVPESTGDLTAADVADLETLRQGDGETGKRQPILSNVPDRMARVQQESDADLAARIDNYRGFLAANPGYVGVEQDLQAALAEQQRRLGVMMPGDAGAQNAVPALPAGASRAGASAQQESDADLAARIDNYRGFLAANPGYVGVEQDLQAALAEQQRRLGLMMPSDISTQPFAPAATQDQPQTITGSNEQTGSEMPVPPPTAEAGAGAGGVEGMVNDEGGMMNGKQVVVPKVDVAYKAVATEWERQNIMDELAARLGLIKVYSSITGGKVIGNQFDPKHLGKTGSDLSRKGYFFTNSKSVAANYARVNGGKVMEFYINPQNVLEVEGTNEMYRVGQDAEKIFASGKKVILFKNADDVHGVADNYMVGVGNEHLIKSANPTELDDNGNLILPSRRLDFSSKDIRGKLMGAKQAGQAEQAQGKMDGIMASRNFTGEAQRAQMGFTNLDVSGRTAGFLNTEILSEARQLIADGFTTFANWSQAMVTRFGRGIREFLQGIWQQITSPQTNAARNVRLGMPQGNAPVSIGAGGFVGGGQASNIPEGQDVTRSRFASPDEAENLYDIQATETMRAESSAWLEANGIEAALAAMEANSPPEGLRIDHLPSLGAQVITRLAKLAESGTEAQRLQADALLDRAGRAWHGKASQEAGRTLQQRAMATDELRGIAPILATKQVLVERADRVVKERFEGGAEGAVRQVKDIDAKASTQAGEELAADLEAETAAKPNKGGNAIPPSERAKIAAKSGRITAKHPNLKKLLDALRKKVAPGMTWAEIFMTLPAEQKARQREIYRRLMLDERLKALNQGERLQLTNELDRAWQRERRKVFVRELEKITGLGKTPKDRDKVKAALPRLLRLMNLGMLNSETFRGAIAQEYGIQQIDAATGAELRKLGEQIQQAPEGLPRRKLEQQFMQRLQNLTGSTMAEVLESWWTASVLSGWRTQMDIALSLANGLEDVTLGSLVTALRTGNGRVAKDALFAMLSNLPTAMNEALDHLLTGNRAAMRSYDAEVKAALEDGNKLFGNVGRQLLNKGGMAKLPGAFMEFVSRLMTALDHINSTSTYEGAKAMALARHPELYEKALTISPQDRQAARTQARLELTGGEAPTTRQQRVEETARMKEILDQRVPLEFQAQAREIGLESALQGEPTGVGYAVYWLSNMINTGIRQLETTAAKSVQDNAAGRTVLHALRLSSTLVKILTGTKFVRTVGHSVTRSLSYAPGIGLVRFAEGGMKGAKADILLAKQLMGTAVGLALLMAFRDGEDDEQGIEGSHRDLTPQQRGQLLAQGRPPYSVWKRDAQGRIRSWNYQQWGIAGVLATIGAMEDQRRYNSAGKDDLAILMDGIVSGSMAWTDKTQLTGLQMLMGKDQAASSSPSSSLAGALNKWASTTVGGLVPRIFKDVDMVISPQLRDTSEWWMKWAGQVPMVRELSSGKRVNIFGEDIVLDRGPTSRITQVGTIDPALRTLGRLNERDIWLPDPTQGVRTVLLADGTRRKMTTLEKDRYQRATGAAYRKFITEQGAALLRMDAELARETISKVTERLRNQAAYQAVRR